MANALTDEKFNEHIKTFWNLIETMSADRQAAIKFMMDNKIGETYFTAPASSREEYHNCFPGGLLEHSLSVCKNLVKMARVFCPGKYSDNTLAFVGLFHDLGKAGDGENEYYLQNKSEWHVKKGMLYEINKECKVTATEDRTIFVLQKYGITMTCDEFVAIRISDGPYSDANSSYKMKEPELALLLHWADRITCSSEKTLT